MTVLRINSLNYCAKAIESFANRPEVEADKLFMEWLIEALSMAEVFILPDGGQIIEGVKPAEYTDLFRIPYPVTALEYKAQIDDDLPDDQEACPERIALCLTPSSKPIRELAEVMTLPLTSDDEGFYVLSIYFVEGGIWNVVPCLCPVKTDAATVKQGAKSGIMVKPVMMPYITGAKVYAQLAQRVGQAEMSRTMHNDYLDELNAAMSFAATMNCANVQSEKIEASKKLNAKRAKKGKPQLPDFHILNIDPGVAFSDNSQNTGHSSSGSKRPHLRRGHIRRLKHKVVWVNSAVIGSGKTLKKQYNISGD